MNNKLEVLRLLYDRVTEVDGYNLFLAEDKMDTYLLDIDGNPLFDADSCNLMGCEGFLLVRNGGKISEELYVGLVVQETGEIVPIIDGDSVSNVTDYIIIYNQNSSELRIINKGNGEELFRDKIINYRVRMADSRVPITILKNKGERLVVYKGTVVELEGHLKKVYGDPQSLGKGKGYICVDNNNQKVVTLNSFGQRY